MCGRFVQLPLLFPERSPWPDLADALARITAKYNLTPTSRAVIVTEVDGAVTAKKMRWGLIAPWAKDASGKYATFNARIETVTEKPAFRAAFKAPRRCLVPMAGWYEWVDEADGKQPYYLTRADGEMLYAAGLWEPRRDFQEEGEDGSCTIIVQDAEDAAARIHDRMPVFLDPALADTWMNAAPDEAMAMLLASPVPKLQAIRVSRRVNNARTPSSPDLIEPVDPATGE